MSQENSKLRIQNYNLFGEARDVPDVVHCESISARSSLHNWEFTPHRHSRLHQVLLIENGGGYADIEGRRMPLSPAVVINVPTGCVHAFTFYPGTEGWVITLGVELLDQTLNDIEGVRQAFESAGLLESTDELTRIVQDISREHANSDFARAHVLRALSGQLIGRVARLLSASSKSPQVTHQTPIGRKFNTLIETQFANGWSVRDYADALAVTPGHLSRVVRAETGLAASKVIEERIIREARRNLSYTNMSISEIAYDLGFIDPAYFSRFFSKSVGISPRKFRANLG